MNWRRDRAEDEAYRRKILMAMAAAEISQERLAAALNMSRNTLRSRIANPADLTRGEDRTLRRVLRMEGTT